MLRIEKGCLILLMLSALILGFVQYAVSQTINPLPFTETFEDSNFLSRGWYDETGLVLSTTEHIPGSTKSVQFRFTQGATKPTSGAAIRKKFTATDSVYVSYWVKYSSNWTGSNQAYHPHEFYLLTNKNGDWDGLASTHLTFYIEQNEGTPMLGIQDGQNIDESRVGQNLVNVTENRAVSGCNGDSDGYGDGACYLAAPGIHANGKGWRAGMVYFSDNSGSYYKNDWHFIEAYIKLNTISGGKAVKDGIMQYWFDGNVVMDYSDIVLRTGQNSDMKFNQFIIAPWIGDGSPVDQSFWVDDLTVAIERSGPPPVTRPSPPTGLRIVEP